MTPQDIARAAALKRFREEHGVTQEQLAAHLDVSQGTLSDWERARKPIPDDRYQRLLEVVNMAGGITPPPEPPPDPSSADNVVDGGTLRGNVWDVPPPTDTPPHIDAAAVAGNVHAAIAGGLSPIGAAALPDVKMFYVFGGQLMSRVTPGGGAVVQARADDLALSLIAAAETNAFLARAVQMMQIGPTSTFLILHVTVLLEVLAIVRQERGLKVQAEAEAAVPTAYATAEPGGGETVTPPRGGMGFEDVFTPIPDPWSAQAA